MDKSQEGFTRVRQWASFNSNLVQITFAQLFSGFFYFKVNPLLDAILTFINEIPEIHCLQNSLNLQHLLICPVLYKEFDLKGGKPYTQKKIT